MKATAVLAALACWFSAACVEPGPQTITWEVRNDAAGPIQYSLLLEGGHVPHWTNASAAPGQVRQHDVFVNGVDLQATAMLRDQPRASAGVPFATDGLCSQHVVSATWDGETWAVDAAATECA